MTGDAIRTRSGYVGGTTRNDEIKSGVVTERKAMIKRETRQILTDEAEGAHLGATPATYNDFDPLGLLP